MMKENRPTTNEFAGSTRQRALAEQRLRAKLASNQEIASTNKLSPGPKVTASTEVQPPHRRPVIRRPG